MKLARFHLFFACAILTISIAVRAANLDTKRADAPQLSAAKLSPVVSCPKKSAHILLPHPTDCNKFFTCDYGVAHPTSCQKGLHFNAKVQACDFPETAGCKSEKDGGEKNNVLCPAEKTKQPVYRPHPSDCGKFYVCDGGKPHLKICQKGLHFNTKIETCDYPRNAGCNSKVVTENPREGTGGCPAVNNGNPVYLPHKTDCRKFYVCDTGVPHLKICQAGLHFNPKVNACDYPANAGCVKDNSKNGPTSKRSLNNLNVCPSIPKGETVLVSHPEDCSKFYLCEEEHQREQKCPSGLHFNQVLQGCDFPEKAQCKKNGRLLGVGKPSPHCSTSEDKDPVFFRHPGNCSVYFMCSHGFAYEFQCPARLHFNLKQKMCDYESTVDCPEEVVTENPREGTDGCEKDNSKNRPTSKRSLDNLNVCPSVQKGEIVLVPHPEDCSKFYLCEEGHQREQKCPSGLHFRQVLQGCDFPEKAQCEKNGRLLGVGKPSPHCSTSEEKDPVFFRHPGNCSVYFMCSHGFAYEFQCPARLHFNLKQKICDYESTVDCPEAIRFYEKMRQQRPIGWGDFVKQYACFFCKEEQLNYSLDFHLVN